MYKIISYIQNSSLLIGDDNIQIFLSKEGFEVQNITKGYVYDTIKKYGFKFEEHKLSLYDKYKRNIISTSKEDFTVKDFEHIMLFMLTNEVGDFSVKEWKYESL